MNKKIIFLLITLVIAYPIKNAVNLALNQIRLINFKNNLRYSKIFLEIKRKR